PRVSGSGSRFGPAGPPATIVGAPLSAPGPAWTSAAIIVGIAPRLVRSSAAAWIVAASPSRPVPVGVEVSPTGSMVRSGAGAGQGGSSREGRSRAGGRGGALSRGRAQRQPGGSGGG